MRKPLYSFKDGEICDFETGEEVGILTEQGEFQPYSGKYANPEAVYNSLKMSEYYGVRFNRGRINQAINRARHKTPEERAFRECCQKEPEGLRWVENPVTWDFTYLNLVNLSEQKILSIIKQTTREIERVCSIEFEEVDGEGGIRISFRSIDQQFGTLGQAYMPTTGHRMGICDLCGDIHIDQAEDWSRESNFFNVFKHELLHAIGIVHTPETERGKGNIMDPFYVWNTPKIFGFGDWELKEIQRRYPL